MKKKTPSFSWSTTTPQHSTTQMENRCCNPNSRRDGRTRACTVKLSNGVVIRRSVRLLCFFERPILSSPDVFFQAEVVTKPADGTKRVELLTYSYVLFFILYSCGFVSAVKICIISCNNCLLFVKKDLRIFSESLKKWNEPGIDRLDI